MKAAKVIATCFKGKEVIEKTRLTGDPLGFFYHSQNFTNTNDIINLLKLHIDLENKFNPGCERDLIIVNADTGSIEGNKFIEEINNNKINNGKIISYTKENYGLSFGSYNDAFLKFEKNYDYFLFTEDDWLILNDNYFKIGIDVLNSNPNNGMVPYVAKTKIHKLHWEELGLNKLNAIGCHGATGLLSKKMLKMIVNKYGCIPYHKGLDYRQSIVNGELKFPNSVVKLGFEIVDLPENIILGMPAYDYMRNIKYKKFPNLFETLNYYLQINLIRPLKKNIWKVVSISNITKKFYLNTLSYLRKIFK